MKKQFAGLKGVREAVDYYRNHDVSNGGTEYVNIMLDISTGEIWVDCFTDSYGYLNYCGYACIVDLTAILRHENSEITVSTVKRKAKQLIRQ